MDARLTEAFTTMTSRNHFFVLAIVAILFFWSCQRDESQETFLNEPLVDITLVVTNIEYLPLQQDGGFIYLQGGRRGIILYRQNSSQYIAFERNCTFRPDDSCALVSVHSSRLFLEDTCCFSNFDFTGRPTSGPSSVFLRRYNTTLNGNLLRITN